MGWHLSPLSLLVILGLQGVHTAMEAGSADVPASSVTGRKLLRIAQEFVFHTAITDVPERVEASQEAGYDGVCLSLSVDHTVTDLSGGADANMAFRWWDVDRRTPTEFARDLQALKSVRNWGCLTDDLVWMASHVAGHKPPDWFSDADWEIVLANARLGAELARDAGL